MAIYALHQSNKYCSIKLFHFIFFLVIYLNEKKLDFSLRIKLNNNNNWEKKRKETITDTTTETFWLLVLDTNILVCFDVLFNKYTTKYIVPK